MQMHVHVRLRDRKGCRRLRALPEAAIRPDGAERHCSQQAVRDARSLPGHRVTVCGVWVCPDAPVPGICSDGVCRVVKLKAMLPTGCLKRYLSPCSRLPVSSS